MSAQMLAAAGRIGAANNAARAIGLAQDYGIAVGKQADLIILDTFRVADALLDIPPRLWVIKRGRITVVTQHSCEIHRHSCCCAQ